MADEPRDLIGYGALINQALRGVVGSALATAAKTGLPGEHHFYITFNTQAPGLVIPPQLAARYPDEMTIVLQHQFEHLEVSDDTLRVTLHFDHRPERLTVPLASVLRFADPAVPFALQFNPPAPEAMELVASSEASDAAGGPEEPPEDDDDGGGGAQVVSLGAFRKK